MDSYTLQARVWPALVVMMPAALAVFSRFPDKITDSRSLIAFVGSCGLTLLLAEFARDHGKRRENALHQRHGGWPTTQRLRHRDNLVDPHTKCRYHNKLSDIVPDVAMPTIEHEASDPDGADQCYASSVGYLRERTRDKKQFPMVFGNLVRYGFARNLWGLKPYAITVCLISILVSMWPLFDNSESELHPVTAIAIGMNAVLLVVWFTFIRPSWVLRLADAYAISLLATLEKIES